MHARLLSIVSGGSWKSEDIPGASKRANVHAVVWKDKESAENYKPVLLV